MLNKYSKHVVLHNISLGNPQEQYLAYKMAEVSDNFEGLYKAIDLPEVEGREKGTLLKFFVDILAIGFKRGV